MRAKEFIKESYNAKAHGKAGKVSDRKSDPLPGVFVQRQLRNTDPYMQYRYALAVASARAIAKGELSPDDFEQESAWSENLVQVMYAPEDEETIMMASKMMGVQPTRITDNKSHEPPGIRPISPVANVKRNKYGV